MEGLRVIQCDICKQPVSKPVPIDAVVYGLVVCTLCCERISERTMNRFLEEASWPMVVNLVKGETNVKPD